MPRGNLLTSNERKVITQKPAQRLTISQIAKDLQRDRRTIKKAIADINFKRKTRSDKGKFMLSDRDMRKLTIIVKKTRVNYKKTSCKNEFRPPKDPKNVTSKNNLKTQIGTLNPKL